MQTVTYTDRFSHWRTDRYILVVKLCRNDRNVLWGETVPSLDNLFTGCIASNSFFWQSSESKWFFIYAIYKNYLTTLVKVFETNKWKQSKLDKTAQTWRLFLRNFWPLLPTCFFLEQRLTTRLCLHPILRFFLMFPNFLRHYNLYTKYRVSFNLRRIKRCKVPKFYEHDCLKLFSLLCTAL